MLGNLNLILKTLNSSKFFGGIMMIILNLGSKYISIKFSKSQEEYIRNFLGRQVLIFAISFVATKDVLISLVLTSVFIILTDHLFNEESSFYILPRKLRKLEAAIDNDKNNSISNDEINKAIKLLNDAQVQNEQFSKIKNYHQFFN